MANIAPPKPTFFTVFARKMHSASEFAKMFLSKCVCVSIKYNQIIHHIIDLAKLVLVNVSTPIPCFGRMPLDGPRCHTQNYPQKSTKHRQKPANPEN